jgi:ribosome maturation factor RimP
LPCFLNYPKSILRRVTHQSGRKPTFLLLAPVFSDRVRIQKFPACGYLIEMAVDIEKIREMAERVAASEGLVLFDVEVKGGGSNQLLRIYIDKPQGVSHADCQAVSEQMSALLDVEDLFPGKYLLEVSSPGLDRQLVKPSDFEYFAGRRARIVLRDPLENHRVLEGHLAGVQSGRVRLDVGQGEIREFDLARISKARLVVEV